MFKQQSLKFNFMMNSILTLSSIIFPLITFPYVSRILLPIGMGKVSFATSIVSYFTLIAQLGIPTYGIRVCARFRNTQQELISNIQELLVINLLMSGISYIGYFILIFSISRFAEDKLLYIIMSISILLNTIGVEWLYKGLEQYTYITIRSVIFKIFALLALFLFVHNEEDYICYGAISILAASASNIFNFINAKKYIFTKSYRKWNFKPHLKAVIIFFAMTCATTIYTHLDIVMIGFFHGDSDVGYYTSAVKIKQFLVSIITSLGAVLLPRSSYYIKMNQYNNFYEISNRAIQFIFILSFPVVIFFTLFAKQSIYFLSGNMYYKSIFPMQILMPTVLFIGLSNLLGIQMLVPLGKEKNILISEILGAITNFTFNLILIPKYTFIGAAIGTLIAEAVVLFYQYIILKNIVEKFLKKINYIKLLFSTLMAMISCIWILNLHLENFLTLCISALIFFSFYFILLIILKEKFMLETINQLTKMWGKNK